MLKSITTQFAMTLFFGPLGLIYSSVAAAVFLSLVMAVLYFTALDIYSVALVWPIAIITGLVFVKMHNDRMRQSGSRLLLGPGEEGDLVSTAGSWGRGFAVLSLMAVAGYFGFYYLNNSNGSQEVTEQGVADMADAKSNSDTGTMLEGVVDNSKSVAAQSDNDQLDNSTIVATVDSTDSTLNSGSSNTITFDENEVTPVVIGTSSSSAASSDFSSSASSDGGLLYVEAQEVNLRDGPGTNYSVLDTVKNGDALQELDRAGRWINVTSVSTGVSGWIFSGLVSPR